MSDKITIEDIEEEKKQQKEKRLKLLDEDQIVQPRLSRSGLTKNKINFISGSKRSEKRLKELGFDPIQRLVMLYEHLTLEVAYQEALRDGRITELTPAGNPKAYKPYVHHNLFDKLANIGEKLLRYGYGRVPETLNLSNTTPKPLIINTTKKDEKYVINGFNGQTDEEG